MNPPAARFKLTPMRIDVDIHPAVPNTAALFPYMSDHWREMSVVWGVHCVESPDAINLEDMVDRACIIAYNAGLARPGDRIAITAGIPLGTPGATNMLRIAFVRQDGAGSS